MPILDGFEATKRIRKFEKQFKVKNPAYIVGISGHTTIQYKQKGLDSGMNVFFAKPFEKEQLDEILKKVGIIK